MNYIIALLPRSDVVSFSFIELANYIVEQLQVVPQYLLKGITDKSLPHLSIIQFCLSANEQKLLQLLNEQKDYIWEKVLPAQLPVCTLPNTISYSPSENDANKTWASIDIDINVNLFLQLYHDALCQHLAKYNITPRNKSTTNYDPHFSLFNTGTSSLKNKKLITTIPETFSLLRKFHVYPVLGTANEHWELTAI